MLPSAAFVAVAPGGPTLEEPARRLAKKYDIERKSSHWPFSQKPDGGYGTTPVRSTQMGDQQMATVPKNSTHDYILWQQVWYKHFISFQTFICNSKVWLQAKKFQKSPVQWKQNFPSLLSDVQKKKKKQSPSSHE